jgi:hypothetical protein
MSKELQKYQQNEIAFLSVSFEIFDSFDQIELEILTKTCKCAVPPVYEKHDSIRIDVLKEYN